MIKRLEQKQMERLVFHDKSIDENKVNIHAFFILAETICGNGLKPNSIYLKGLIGEIEKLDVFQIQILELRYGLYNIPKKTCEECADVLGVKKEKIKHMEAKTLRMLRHPIMSNNFIISRMITKRENEIKELSEWPITEFISIKSIGLSNRAVNALQKADITNVTQLENLTKEDLYKIKGIGKTVLNEIWTKVHEN